MTPVQRIVDEQKRQERRYQLLQAAAILRAATWIPADADPQGMGRFELETDESIEYAEDMLERLEQRDKKRNERKESHNVESNTGE